MDQEVIMATPPLPPPPRARCIVRLKLPPAWTPEEDARLQRLAKENGFRRWSRVARSMPRRSARSCRDRWRHHLARATSTTAPSPPATTTSSCASTTASATAGRRLAGPFTAAHRAS
ncbi:Os10g0350400 [Oryza sativa Japonica Group]|uniref:Os10g0350400 protein n=1 Tax=Oryza sativa subsp. japonica TaxID=39947 RepID=A0A0P0XT38_ORYSJ|nr:Os10g0350400 [Oryza sativa Japonica Group]